MGTIRLERNAALLTLRLDKPRGNAIDEALVDELASHLVDIEADATVRGVLLASAHRKVFCPGLDLVGLLEYDPPAMRRFMMKFARMTWRLYGLAKPVVAAVGGHAVAGGCILALTADHRVLRAGAMIGLNEIKVGVPLPWSVSVLLRGVVPPGSLGRIALLGRNFSGPEAVAVGLVDELATEDAFEATCAARLVEFAEKDPAALAITKRDLRSGALAEMQGREEEMLHEFLDAWFSGGTQERIRGIVASLPAKG